MNSICIIGGGLAGSEAALTLANRDVQVTLYEMRPTKTTPAHASDKMAELVCSNSLKSNDLSNAQGVLKAELRLLESYVLQFADGCAIPGGKALVVDRNIFAERVTQAIESHPNIRVVREEKTEIPEQDAIIAAGPLVSEALQEQLLHLGGEDGLFFFDALAPIIAADSIDYDIVYAKNRYDDDNESPDYLNCPFTQEEYQAFYEALTHSEQYALREFESRLLNVDKFHFYQNCMPVEELARRGERTLLFGVLRPVGLRKPNGERPYAVLQLRAENQEKTMYNLVGFQTMMRHKEQKRVFRLIPGLEKAEFLRYGAIHRNSYLNSPLVLDAFGQLKARKNVFVAGQLSGVEGYMEAIFTGKMTALAWLHQKQNQAFPLPPKTTLSGALLHYLIEAEAKGFQPMNANFGLVEPLPESIRNKKLKKELLAKRALEDLQTWKNGLNVF